MSGTAENGVSPNFPSQGEVRRFPIDGFIGDNARLAEFLDKYGTGFIDATDQWGNTALILAVLNGKKDTVALLLERGANIDAKNNQDWTALMYAERNEREAHEPADLSAFLRQWPTEQKKKKEAEDRERAVAAKSRMERLERLRPPKHFLKKSG